MFTRPIMLPILLLLGGCAAGAGQPLELPSNHPANPKATEVAYAPPPNVLGVPAPRAGEPSSPPSLPGVTKGTSPARMASVSPETKKSLEEILGAYEQIRVLLASDKLEGISEIADALAKTASSASTSGPEPLRPDLKGIADAAEKLKHAQHLELPGTRKVFGDLSKYAVRLVISVPALEQGRKVFTCLMRTKDYNKWIQPGSTASNPYYGKEMLECGDASEWKE